MNLPIICLVMYHTWYTSQTFGLYKRMICMWALGLNTYMEKMETFRVFIPQNMGTSMCCAQIELTTS